jgi:uncharacterized membrane protein
MDAVQVSLRGLIRRQNAPLYGILVLGISIRMLFLSLPIALDEATTYNSYASQFLGAVLSDYSAPNNHIFHTLLVHLVTQFGNDEWIIRLPAFVAGITLIPVTYQVGKHLFNSETGLLAAAFVAASSPLIEYSVNARGYTLLVLSASILVLVAAHLLERESLSLWIRFSVFSSLGFYTVPVMLYPFSGVVVWLALSFVAKGEERRLFSLLAACTAVAILTVLLYLPVMLRSGAAAVIDNAFVRALSWAEFAQDLPESLVQTWQLWNRDIPLVLQLLLLLGFLISLLFHGRISRFRIPLILVVIATSFANYVVVPVSDPLIYYFNRFGLSLHHLGGDLQRIDSERLLVIVLEPDYTLDSILALMGNYGLHSQQYSNRVQIAQFRTTSLWELTP